MNAIVHSFGCRLNIAESEAIRAALSRSEDPRSLVVINGCAVTGNAMREARTALRRARREHPQARIVATGCAAQVDPDGFAAMPEVDLVLGNAEKLDAASYARNERVVVGDIMALTRTAPQMVPAFSAHARAFLEVQNGCDHRCTFCVIPFGRGPSRSVPVAAAVEAAQRLVTNGHRELVLTGVDLTSYGHDLPETPTLADLIAALLNRVSGLGRIRLGSVDVAEIDTALFELLTQETRMMPHVHLSLQHGDDLMLKRMKRRHSRAQAVAMVGRLKAARAEMAIGADLIAGFPTENEAAAKANASLIADCDIVFAHVFPYSPRAGTPAARMPQLSREAIKARAAVLRAVGAAHRSAWLTSQVGALQSMLVERDGVSGHANNFARVRLTAPAPAGEVAQVRILGVDGDALIGEGAE